MTEHATPDHGERAHAVLSASGADRWLNCPGSVALTRDLPDTTSEYAEWGTRCHELGELALRNRLLGHHVVFEEGRYDSEMYEAVAAYRSFVDALIVEYGEDPVVFIEQRLDFSRWVPGGFGTGDLVLVFIQARTAVMVDLKGGKGIKVFAADNPQLKLYGAGTLELLDMICEIDSIELCIAQPRLDHFDRWKLTVPELLAWLVEVKPIAQAAYKGSTALSAGDHCTFCKVKATCPERAREAMSLFEEHDSIPGLLTMDQIAALLPKLDRIINWAKNIQDFAYTQAKDHGGRIPGYKLVTGRTARKWADEKRVAQVLAEEGFTEDDIYTKKILGIGDAEKLVGKKHRVFELAVKAEGKPTLVPESDPRAEWRSEESVLANFDE
jgi:hypothetical protein